jgi:phosphatidylglycerophosphate synthase
VSNFLTLIGMLIFLFCFCYFIAATGNDNAARSGKKTDNLGCAIILFVAALIYIVFKAIH